MLRKAISGNGFRQCLRYSGHRSHIISHVSASSQPVITKTIQIIAINSMPSTNPAIVHLRPVTSSSRQLVCLRFPELSATIFCLFNILDCYITFHTCEDLAANIYQLFSKLGIRSIERYENENNLSSKIFLRQK